MSDNNLINLPTGHPPLVLPNIPPFVWPEPRIHTNDAKYVTLPPFEKFMSDADLIAGALVGVTDKTVQWLETIMANVRPRTVKLVIVLYPASPTREQHLLSLQRLQEKIIVPGKVIDVRLFPLNRVYGNGYEQMALLPTILQATSTDGKTMFCIGSVGDTGRDAVNLASFNIVFQPDDALRDSWRRWFEHLFTRAARLTPETVHIPHLTPAIGDPAAVELWDAYKRNCLNRGTAPLPPPKVELKTGETTHEGDGKLVTAWDNNRTKLDPLAQRLVQVYAQGCLVTIDDSTWINPLDVPVKAALLLWQSELSVGAVKHKQAFNLRVLDEATAKHLGECRSVRDLMSLSYLLSEGSRWISGEAKSLLEEELEARNREGQSIIKRAMDGNNVEAFIEERRDAIRRDLDKMYSLLNQGTSVPENKVSIIFDEVKKRLNTALTERITPGAIYNKVAPPDLTVKAPAENWRQPLSLLLQSARNLRKSLIDGSFPNKFTAAMDVFGDVIVKTNNRQRAQHELVLLKEIEESPDGPKEKCTDVWNIITGKGKP